MTKTINIDEIYLYSRTMDLESLKKHLQKELLNINYTEIAPKNIDFVVIAVKNNKKPN